MCSDDRPMIAMHVAFSGADETLLRQKLGHWWQLLTTGSLEASASFQHALASTHGFTEATPLA